MSEIHAKCQFYNKIGACRHGEKCSRNHTRPTHSKTIIITNLYQNPELDEQSEVPAEKRAEHFSDFYKDVFVESSLVSGDDVEELIVCENHNDHLNGNVYVKFRTEQGALRARDNFSARWYDSRPVYCELSPVADFRDATCRQHDTKSCDRGGMCNFMHIKRPSTDLLKQLKMAQRKHRLQ